LDLFYSILLGEDIIAEIMLDLALFEKLSGIDDLPSKILSLEAET